MRGRGECISYFIDEAINHSSGAVKDAALHALESVAPYHVGWLLNGDGGELRGARTEGVERCFDTRNNQAALENVVFIDNTNSGSCTKIDNNGWYALAGCSAYGIGQTVFT